jgi:hypothetical protein
VLPACETVTAHEPGFTAVIEPALFTVHTDCVEDEYVTPSPDVDDAEMVAFVDVNEMRCGPDALIL